MIHLSQLMSTDELKKVLQYETITTDYFTPWKMLLEGLLKQLEIDGNNFNDLLLSDIDSHYYRQKIEAAYGDVAKELFMKMTNNGHGVCINHVYFSIIKFFEQVKEARLNVKEFVLNESENKNHPDEVEVLKSDFELLKFHSTHRCYIMDCTVERGQKTEVHYSLCFVSVHGPDCFIMDPSLKKAFHITKNAMKNESSSNKKLDHVVAMTDQTFHRWNIQGGANGQELVVSKFCLDEKNEITTKNYQELPGMRMEQWRHEFLHEVFLSNSLRYGTCGIDFDNVNNKVTVKNRDQVPKEFERFVAFVETNPALITTIRTAIEQCLQK